jgi:hypothetical protein
MKALLFIIFCIFFVSAQDTIAQDTVGLVVEVKEKYGALLLDTCNILMLKDNQFVLVKKSLPSAWFPTSFHSVRVVARLSTGVQDEIDK